ncbi:MAG: alpha-amylase family protein [Pirellulaceae bacterium]|jgi:hypothetical protein|nr:alpha-amylase family protein [Pirellulaceae bacterium]
MDRRQFMQLGATAAAASTLTTAPHQPLCAHDAPAVAGTAGVAGAPAILADFTADDHRRRLTNIRFCTQKIRQCLRQHLVTDYLPAQCVYNLGEYPSRVPWEPDEYDEQELDRLKEHGIQLIHVMDEWNDRYGLFGGNKLTAVNPEGFRRFISMVHQRGIKILAYASSGYFVGSDPDYRVEWSRPGDAFGGWWDLTRCAPASPGWRAYFLPRMLQILEDYELDGLYNDWGYVPNADRKILQPAPDEVVAFEETPQYDGAMTDLLYLIYCEIKRRGGIYKLHADFSNQPLTGGLRVYDYLWVGEGVDNADRLREAVKNHVPYVVPCIHGSIAQVSGAGDHFLHAIPYLQFPLLQGGRPLTGERAVVPIPRLPGVQENGFYTAAWEYYQQHPDGPYIYGGWDPIPPNIETRPQHARWLKQYLPMVEDGTWAYLEITDSDLFASPWPAGCVASMFANRELYLVLANYGTTAQLIETTDAYVSADERAAAPARQWPLPPRSLRILRSS